MTSVVHACRLLTVSLALVMPLQGQSLAQRLDARLDAPSLDRHIWGVAVTDLDGNILYGRNADRMMMPASNTKLVVSAVASAMLGPDFRVRTSVYGTGPVVDGVLHGDLVLYGRGDPTFSNRCFQSDTTATAACDREPIGRYRDLARQLKSRGVRTIAGDLVGDGSYFTDAIVHPGWEFYDLYWWYAAPVSALGFNDNSVDIRITSRDTAGGAPILTLSPDIGLASIDNRAEIGPRGIASHLRRVACTRRTELRGHRRRCRRVRARRSRAPPFTTRIDSQPSPFVTPFSRRGSPSAGR